MRSTPRTDMWRTQVTVVITFMVMALHSAPAVALCPAPVEVGSAAFDRRMRTLEKNDWIVVRGTIANEVPEDAHNIWSIYIDVERYLVGSGPDRVTVTSEGDGLTIVNRQAPGSAKAESQAALKRLGGKDAVVFAKPEFRGDADDFVTGSCGWNRFGDGVDEVESHLRAALGLPPIPVDSPGAPFWLKASAVAAIAFALALFALLRRKLSRSVPRASP